MKAQSRNEFIFSRWTLRNILSHFTKTKPSELCFSYSKYGKPRIIFPENSGIEFNVSHSKDFLAVAISDSTPIGIDIEYQDPDTDILELSRIVHTESQIENIISHDQSEQISHFFDLWTAKEAYIKAIGKGFSFDPKDIELCSHSNRFVTRTIDPKMEHDSIFYKRFSFHREYLVPWLQQKMPTLFSDRIQDQILSKRKSYIMQFSVKSNPWIQRDYSKANSVITLFCFPHSGGGASSYRKFSDNLPNDVEVIPIQLPGREIRFEEAPISQMSKLIPPLAEAITPYLNRPYAFFGHRLGSLVSFELTRELRRRNQTLPKGLFLSACSAPQLPDIDPPIYDAPNPVFIERLRKYNGTPPEILEDQELIEIFLPMLRADFSLSETYSYSNENPFSFPIFVYGGDRDSTLS